MVHHRILKKYSKSTIFHSIKNKYLNKSNYDISKIYSTFIKQASRAKEKISNNSILKRELNPITRKALSITEREKRNYGSNQELRDWRKAVNKINNKKERDMDLRGINKHIKKINKYITQYHSFDYVNEDTDELTFNRLQRRLVSSQAHLQVCIYIFILLSHNLP